MRTRTPSYEEYRAAGHDHETAQALVGIDGICEQQRERHATLRRMPAKVRREYATYLRTGRLPEARARAPREARNDRPRGSRRSTVRRSSERSGDSGSDSESSEPAPRRLCAFCGKDIPADRSPRATYCTDRHADRDRQRRKRARDRGRANLPVTPITAADRRMWELDDDGRTRLWELVVCRCNGHHLEFEEGWCTKCGHWLPNELSDGTERYAAFSRRPVAPCPYVPVVAAA